MSQMITLFTLTISLFTISMSAMAFSLPLPVAGQLQSDEPFILSSVRLQGDFEGIVRLSNCSGALVTLEGKNGSDKALVATNGHCLRRGFLDPDQQIVNEPNTRTMRVYDRNGRSYSVRAELLVYATMSKTDFAIYQLNETFDQINQRTGGVEPLLLSPERGREGTPIDIISGYHGRTYRCQIDQFVYKLKEHRWTWSDSIRYMPGCSTIPGTSGSPIIERGTRTVIGVNNTSYTGGAQCSLHNPCEIDEAGEVTVRRSTSYGQQTYWIYSCLDEFGTIDFTVDGCRLP